MSKELIISSNRFEKKIVVVENGVLTEFYIERSNENQGVAGNIYKGRVMKVLPGMQSAFVDIGLERDAFLYVSDFVDEDDELDKEDAEGETPKGRSESRPHLPPRESTRVAVELGIVEIAARAPASTEAAVKAVTDEDEVKRAGAPSEPGKTARSAAARDAGPARARGRLTRRGGRGSRGRADVPAAPQAFKIPLDEGPPLERVTDDDLNNDAGALLKEVLIHQMLEKRLHEAEYSVPEDRPIEIEPAPTATVGSLKDQLQASHDLERVVDEEEHPSGDAARAARPRAGLQTASPNFPLESEANEGGADSPEKPQGEKTSDSEASFGIPPRRENFSRRPTRRGPRSKYSPRSRPQTSGNDAAAQPAESAHPATPTITDLLKEGQEILVQIAKEPIASKGARITSHIALPGRYAVYMPTVDHIGVSRKIPSDEERLRLKRLMIQIRKEEACQGGFIVRTAGAGRSDEDLRQDAKYLIRTWNDVRKNAEKAKAPAVVHRDLDLVQRLLRDQLSEEFSVIRVDNEAEYQDIIEFVHRIQPKMVRRVKLHTKDTPIFEQYGVQEEIDKALRPRVWLKSGGYIVINQTEALVAIDVNTGKFVGKSNRLEDTIVKTNLDAVKEIVRQIRLRDLGGIIVLDLIDMEERKNRQKVMQLLEEEIKSDRSPSKILQFNEFGLVAITRKRVKQSLERTLCTTCPNCSGSGLVKSPRTVCYEVFSEARKIAKDVTPSSDVTLRVNPEVAKMFRSEEKRVLEEIEGHLGCPVTLRSDPSTHIEQFDFAVL